MGWLIAGLVIAITASVTAAGFSIANNVKQQEINKQNYENNLRNQMTGYENDIIGSVWSDLDAAQGFLQSYQTELDNAVNNAIPEYEDWLSKYQGMLNGEDNAFTQERNTMVDSIANTEAQLENYEYASALQVQSIFEDANSQINQAKKQASLENVAASATGSAISAYRTEATKVQSDIMRYVGSDGYLNEATGEGDIGTFAKSLMSTRGAIADQKKQYALTLDSLRLSLSQWDEDMADMAKQTQYDLETANKNIETWTENIEKYKQVIEAKSQQAMEKIKQWETDTRNYYSSTGEKSTAEVDKLIAEKKASWKSLYESVGVTLDI